MVGTEPSSQTHLTSYHRIGEQLTVKIAGALIFIALALTSPVFFGSTPAVGVRRWIGYGAGALSLVIATTGATAIVSDSNALLAHAVGALGTVLLTATVFFATARWLEHGLLKALDLLAENWWLSWMVTWPSDEEEKEGVPKYPLGS